MVVPGTSMESMYIAPFNSSLSSGLEEVPIPMFPPPKMILPVYESPIARVCLLVVEMVEAELKVRFPEEVALPVVPKI